MTHEELIQAGLTDGDHARFEAAYREGWDSGRADLASDFLRLIWASRHPYGCDCRTCVYRREVRQAPPTAEDRAFGAWEAQLHRMGDQPRLDELLRGE